MDLRQSPWNSQTLFVLMVLALVAPIRLPAAGFDRIEINVPDPPSAAAWYAKNLEGRATTLDSAPAVAFGNVTLRFGRVRGPIADSVGSGIDHLGFSYGNIDAAMQRFARSGVRIVSGIEKDGPVRYAFIHDPWSTLIEVVEDPEIRGFHHIHLASRNPKTTLKWYTEVFGEKVSRFAGLIPGIRYGKMWVLVKGIERPAAPTKGRAIDHVCWHVADFDAVINRLHAKGAVFESRPGGKGAARSLFVQGPDAVRLELVRRGTR